MNAPALHISEVGSYEDYNRYAKEQREINEAHRLFENELIPAAGVEFTLNGYCYVCGAQVDFFIDYNSCCERDGIRTPNWRERLVCPRCQLNNRMRATANIFDQICRPNPSSSIYMTEQTTLLYQWFEQKYSHVCGSEYLGSSLDLGTYNDNGTRNEDLTALSFDNDSFDFIASFDVLEHIPDYRKALSECRRCLKPDGKLLFSVPFAPLSPKNIVRASVSETGEVINLLPPEIHGDPLSSDGCLCFYHFGWEILGDLKAMGFKDAKALFYWSGELGYLGGEQNIFVATKDAPREEVHHDSSSNVRSQQADYEYAAALLKEGKTDEACSLLLEILKTSSKKSLVLNDLGVISFQKGNSEEAIQYLRRAVAADGQNTTIKKNLADLLLQEKDPFEAMDLYQYVVQRDPKDTEAMLALAGIMLRIDRLKVAKNYLTRVLELQPDHADARQILENIDGRPETSDRTRSEYRQNAERGRK
jgi:tetratricopeptide (TPR) repeat protein